MFDILYVYSGAERIGVLQNEKSIQWIENYRNSGEAKIVCVATAENVALLALGNRIYNPDTRTIADIVATDVVEWSGEAELTVRAQTSAAELNRRVIMATEVISNVEAGMRRIYTNNRRDLPIVLGTEKGFTETISKEITWDTVLEAYQVLSEASGLGFRVKFDPATGTEALEVYKGTDRTSGEHYNGYFSTELGNMLNFSLGKNENSHCNVAIVAGEGEGKDRVVVIVSLGNHQGRNRRELYVNASSTRKEYQILTPTGQVDEHGNPTYTSTTGTYTDAQYATMLRQVGISELLKNITTITVSSEVTQNPLEFGKDYFLGDILPLKSVLYNMNISARVLSATFIREETGDKMMVTLGDFTTMEG